MSIKQKVLFNKLFDNCEKLTLKHLEKILQNMFDHADDALFALAEKTDSTTDSTAYFDSMRIIRLKRSEIETQYFSFIKQAFSNAKNNTSDNTDDEPTLDSFSMDDLSLIEETDLEENIAIKNIVTKVSHHYAQDLSAIEKRLTHILENEISAKNNPLGPEVICHAFMQAAAELDIELKVSLIILKLFDQGIVSGLSPLLHEANNLFISANVLPEFKHRIQKSEHVDSPYNTTPNDDVNPSAEQNSNQQYNPMQSGSYSQPQTMQGGYQQANPSHPSMVNTGGATQDTSINHFHELLAQQHPPEQYLSEQQPILSNGITNGFNPNGFTPSGVPNNVHPISQAQTTAGYHQDNIEGLSATASAGGYAVSTPQFIGSLTQLQNVPLPISEPTTSVSVNEAGDEVEHVDLQSTTNLKQFVIQQLQQQDESFSVNNINPIDQDVIDVVSMLFDFILEDNNIPDAAKAHIARLQIPLLKAAIIDKDFFSTNKNPARNLLNALAHAAIGIIDEDDTSSQKLLSEIQRVVDNINSELEDDLSLFDTQLNLFNTFMEEHDNREENISHKIERKSKRKEDNALAYQWVEDTVDEILDEKHLPDFIVDLIHGPWKKVMLNTYLNNGQNSDTWKNQVRFIDVLEWSIQPKHESVDRQKLANIIGQLVLTLRNGLQVIQVSGEDIQSILMQLEPFHLASMKGLSVKDYLATRTPHEAFLFSSNDEIVTKTEGEAEQISDVENITVNKNETLESTASEQVEYEVNENYETNLSLEEIDQTILKMEQELIDLEALTTSLNQPTTAAPYDEQSDITENTTNAIDTKQPEFLEQMEDEFSLLGDNDDMEDDNFNKLITEDIVLSGYSATEDEMPEDQPQDEYLELARHLEQGKWVEFLDDNKQKTRAKLAWKSELLGEYTFLNWKFDVIADKTLYGLAADLRRGSATIIDDVPLVDRALSAVMSSLTPKDQNTQSNQS